MTCLKCSENRLLWPIVVVCASVLATGCGAARHAPHPYPGTRAPRAVPPAIEEPGVLPPTAERPAEAPGTGTVPAGGIGEAAATTALSLQGVPYANGGADTDGFDCSGFVQYVFARWNVSLPRSVREQFETGVEVAGPPRAGDLIFFAIDGDRVSHVGIATGPDTFVHAPSSRGVVREDRLSAVYWSRRYAGARRVLENGL